MRKLLIALLLLVVMVAFVVPTLPAQENKEVPKTAATAAAKEAPKEKVKHEYVGAAKCKVCHAPQYNSWAQTKHAKAFDALSAEEKKNDACVVCHITGKMADATVITNVECEACHGPGSDYKSMQIMNKKKWEADAAGQKKLAMDAGLIFPTAENCARCHKAEGNTHFKALDFATAKTKVHPVAAAPAPAAPK